MNMIEPSENPELLPRANKLGWFVALLSTTIVLAVLFLGHQAASAYHYYHIESLILELTAGDFEPEKVYQHPELKALFERDNLVSRQSVYLLKLVRKSQPQ